MNGKHKALAVSAVSGLVIGWLAYGVVIALMLVGGVSVKAGEAGANSAVIALLFVGIGSGRWLYRKLLSRWSTA